MKRSLDRIALLVLLLAGLYTYWQVFAFSQTRFFTVDEYQYGHATWLVAQGRLPYVDFFEHHFPGSYVLHAPWFRGELDFPSAALLLRRIVFVSWLALGALTAWAGLRATGDRLAAALLAFVPIAFGFSLMSAVDYRADNFGAIYFGACLALLEWNRSAHRRSLAVAAGVLAVLAAAMTQKMAAVGGASMASLLAADWLARRSALGRALGNERQPFVSKPLAFLAAAGGLGLAALAVAGALGLLAAGFEATIAGAVEHERLYDAFSLFGRGYVQPFWEATWPATAPLLVLAAGFWTTREGRFWLVPAAFAALGSALLVAPYPYNFVFPCWLLGVSAVRGFSLAVRRLGARFEALDEASPLLYLLPLAALGLQLGFVSGSSSNAHQLRVLQKIQEHGLPGAAVIDGAGGAMFSPHASYYWYHGVAHRKMFRDYFERELVDDWRRSRALFWIQDGRFRELPKPARDYLQQHYVHGGDGLHVLGTRTPAGGDADRVLRFEVVRAAEYRFHPVPGSTGAAVPAEDRVRVDGVAPRGGRLHLEPGVHEIRVLPGAPSYRIAPVAASFFDAKPAPARYTMMFEYREHRAAEARTALDLVARFPTATVRDGAAAEADRLTQRPGSEIRYHLLLPAAPRLRGHARLAGPRDATRDPRGALTVEIRSTSRSDRLVAEPLSEPLRHPGLTVDTDLSAYGGEMVEIRLGFESDLAPLRLVWDGLRIDERIETPEAPTEEPETRALERGPANVLLVLFDTLRADRTEPYGARRVRTPAIAALADSGATFVDATANASWTAPSVASMLTSVYPSVHGISGTGWMRSEDARVTSLHPALPYLPEILQDAGFRTRAVVKNPFFHSAFGFGRGFDDLHRLYQRRREIREQQPTPEAQADAIFDELIAPLAAPGEPPFFVYLHELDPHHPYDPLPPWDTLYPAEWEGDKDLVRRPDFGFVYSRRPELLSNGGTAWLDAQYDGEVSFMDAYLGRLLVRLEESGLRDETLVVFVSDHGESLTEHGMVGHGLRLWQELLQVPLILSLPGRIPQGLRVETPVEGVDLSPTLLDLLAIEVPEGMQGRSLVPLLAGAPAPEPRPRFAQAIFGRLYSYDAVRFGPWKLIRQNPVARDDGETGKEASGTVAYELYDLSRDPGETQNRWDGEPVVGNTLRAMLEWRVLQDAARDRSAPADAGALDAQMRRNLQALGYLE